MYNFSLMLHVIAAVFLTGPFVLAPMAGLRAVRRGDVTAIRSAARSTRLFTLLALITVVFGMWVLSNSRFDFGTTWVVISMTLFVIAFILALLVTSPALNKAAKILAGQNAGSTDEHTAPESQDPANSGKSTGREPKATPVSESEPLADQQTSPHADADADKASQSGPRTWPQPQSGRDRVHTQYGRIAASSGISAVLLLAVTALMVLKPFH